MTIHRNKLFSRIIQNESGCWSDVIKLISGQRRSDFRAKQQEAGWARYMRKPKEKKAARRQKNNDSIKRNKNLFRDWISRTKELSRISTTRKSTCQPHSPLSATIALAHFQTGRPEWDIQQNKHTKTKQKILRNRPKSTHIEYFRPK